MWGGRAKLLWHGATLHFSLWYHGGDDMTPEEAQEHISLKMISLPDMPDGNGLDVYWYCFMTSDAIWYHPKGWFGNKALSDSIETLRRVNYNFARNETAPIATLVEMGFIQL
jgi:hypothetical protein